MGSTSGFVQILGTVREKSKEYYGRYSFVIDPVLRFCVTFLALALINGSIGYMAGLRNVLVMLMISLICALLPFGGICMVLSLVVLAHVYKASMEMAAVCAVYLIVVACLYYTFSPGNSLLLLMTPIAFALRIPYAIVFAAGLGTSVFSVVPVAAGTVLFYLLKYVKDAKDMVHDSSTDIAQRFLPMVKGVFADKEMYILIGVFIAAILIVYIIHILSVDYSWYIAIGAGAAVLLAGSLIGSMAFHTELNVIALAAGILSGMAVGAVLAFFGFATDYAKTEFTQFEDDDYYYYVKAVPKISADVHHDAAAEDADMLIAKPRSRKGKVSHG